MDLTMAATHAMPAMSSTGQPAVDPVAEEKRFPCTYPGCNKRFTRAEHMNRHALNHTPGEHTCLECRAHFKRPDLLRRHMSRHRQRALEASRTAGAGVLNTRKRSWKTLSGAIVQTRPYAPFEDPRGTAAESAGAPRSPLSDSRPEQDEVDPRVADLRQIQSTGTIDGSQSSELESEATTAFAQTDWQAWTENSAQDFANLEYEQIFQPDTASSFNMPYTTALDYNWLFNNLDPGILSDLTQEHVPRVQDIPMTTEDFASSGDYCDPIMNNQNQYQYTAPTPESVHSNPAMGSTSSQSTYVAAEENPPSQEPMHYIPMATSTTHQEKPYQPQPRPRRQSRQQQKQYQKSQEAPRQNVETHRREQQVPAMEPERPLSMLENHNNLPIISPEVRGRLLTIIEMSNPHIPQPTYNEGSGAVRDHPLLSLPHLNSYLEHFFTHFNTVYPLLHMATFDASKAEPLLLLSMILLGATYSSSKETHQLAVCIHDVIRPSIFAHAGFSAKPELWILQTILLVECFGKSRAGQTQHDMSHLFHGLLINLIRRSDCQSVRPQGPPPSSSHHDRDLSDQELEVLWRHWAVDEEKKRLALICFMFDTQHAVLFCQSLCMSAFELRLSLPCRQATWEAPNGPSWAAQWRKHGIGEELSSGPAFLSALKWYLTPPRKHPMPPPPHFSSLSRVLILHGLMSVAWDMQRREQTALGVAAVSTSVATTPGSSNPVHPSPSSSHWRQVISTAYDAWRGDFDMHCDRLLVSLHSPSSSSSPSSSTAQQQLSELQTFASSHRATYHAASALLRMDFLDVQIYAGARHILGKAVGGRDYRRSRGVVKGWVGAAFSAAWGGENGKARGDGVVRRRMERSDAEVAAWHAAKLLGEAVGLEGRGGVGRQGDGSILGAEAMGRLFHVPWCLYLGALTCWCVFQAWPRGSLAPGRGGGAGESSSVAPRYGSFVGGRGDEDEEDDDDYDDDDDEMVWDPEADMRELVRSMASEGYWTVMTRDGARARRRMRRLTMGLVWVMADELTKVRWGIIRAGVVVLRGLVPQRLINRYEDPF